MTPDTSVERCYIPIENHPPLASRFRQWLEMINLEAERPLTMEKVIKESRTYEEAYLSFMAIQKIGEQTQTHYRLTGFEPYFIGQNKTPADVALSIARIGAEIIKNRRYKDLMKKLIPSFRAIHDFKRFPSTDIFQLIPELKINDLLAIDEILCEEIGRLRGMMSKKQDAVDYQNETHRLVNSANLNYIQYGGAPLKQRYYLPRLRRERELQEPDLSLLNKDPDLLLGYCLMCVIGSGGHPLIRTLIRKLNSQH